MMPTFKHVLCALLAIHLSQNVIASDTQPQGHFYAGINAAVDAGQVHHHNKTAFNHNVFTLQGYSAGLQLGYEVFRPLKSSKTWQQGVAVELSADNSSASAHDLEHGLSPYMTSYRIKTNRSLSMLPTLMNHGTRYFMRLGATKTRLVHLSSGSANFLAPEYRRTLFGWMGGVGIGHPLSDHWLWRAEWDAIWYPHPPSFTNGNGDTVSDKLRQSIWRLSLSYHTQHLLDHAQHADGIPSGLFMGLGAGYDRLSNHYNYRKGANNNFHYDALSLDGPAAQFTVGYRWQIKPQFQLAIKLSDALMNSAMKYESGTYTSVFSYKHNQTASATIEPGWQFSPGQMLFVDLGAGRVHIKRQGTSNVGGGLISDPNYTRWQNAFIWGAGYRSMLSPHNALVMHVQYAHAHPFKTIAGSSAYKNSFSGPLFLITWEHFFSRTSA